MTFRFATQADIPALIELVESAYRGDVSRRGWTTEADMLDGRRTGADDLQDCISDPHGGILMLLDEHQQILGCANISVQDGAGYFGMFAVKPDLQNAGIGKRILAEAERIARDEWKQQIMRMTVIDIRDELLAFYARRGYRRTGITKPFPYGDERFGLPRRDDLQFEILEKDLTP